MGYEDDDTSYSFVNDDQDGEDDDDDDNNNSEEEEDEEEEDTGHINRGNRDNEDWNDRIPQPRSPPPPLKHPRRPAVNDGEGMNEVKERKSENQRSKERIIPLKPDELYVDWGSILRSSATTPTWWVHQPFVNHNLPLIEIDKLIGHSTHLTTYHHPCTSTRQGRTFHNPLLGLPNIPLRPTLLQHLILNPATKLTAAFLQQQHHHNYYHFVNDTTTNDTPNTDDNPRPPKQARRGTKSSAGHHHSVYYERFHHSAAMAIAMFLEEMMTATLLPLAQQYVQHCRRHYPDPDQEQDGRIWTLPPEEAILRLYHDSNHWSGSSSSSSSSHTCNGSSSNDHIEGSVSSSPSTTLLSTRIATRSRVPGAMGTSLLNQPHERSDRARIAHGNWCRTTATTTHHSRPPWQEWMERDASFYQLFIDNIPPPAVTVATDAAEATLVTNDLVIEQMANEI